ncbi:MAG: DUF6155 family protein [Cyanobacteria bacterium P01_G01_bin.19]
MNQPKITLTTLKKHLKSRSQAELIDEIAELYKRFKPVKEYYQIQLNSGNDAQVIENYKKKIENEFFPSRGLGRAKLSVAKKAISDYKKVAVSSVSVIDLMLFYVEQGVKFTQAYGDIDEPFYYSMESTYDRAIQDMTKFGLKDTFRKRCQQIVLDTRGMGWGFHDMLQETYEDAFE